MDTSGFLISSAIRATTRVRSWSCSASRRWAASSFWAVRSSKTSTAPSGCAVLVPDRIGRDLQPQPAQGELDLERGPPARPEASVSYSMSPSGEGRTRRSWPTTARGRQLEDLLGPPVERAHPLVAADGDHAARHVGQDPLAELLLPRELVVQRDVAQGRGQVGGEVEQRLASRGGRRRRRTRAGRAPAPPPARRGPGAGTATTACSSLQLAQDLGVEDRRRRPPAGPARPASGRGRRCGDSRMPWTSCGARPRLATMRNSLPERRRAGAAPCGWGAPARRWRRGTCRAPAAGRSRPPARR